MKAGLLATLGLAGALIAGPAPAADLTAAQAVEALRRHVCFSRTWWADPYARLGQTVTVDLRVDGRTAYLWSEDMRAIPRVRRWADSYMVAMRATGPMVTQRSGYNIELLRGEPAYERERRRIYAAQTQRMRVELPTACEPKFDPDTPAKAEMRTAVLSSLSTAIATWGKRPARGGVRMIVADFNTDYPETFAYRQDTGQVLRIGLLAGGAAGHTGRYAIAPVPPGLVAAQLRRLIQKYGQPHLVTVR